MGTTTAAQLVRASRAHLEVLRALAAQLTEPSTPVRHTLRLSAEEAKPSPTDVRAALEQGFACLVSLEAELQRALVTETTLIDTVRALHGALIHLRELSGTEPRSWRTRGFVLPATGLRRAGAVPRTPQPEPG
jgi:hypothetical protein